MSYEVLLSAWVLVPSHILKSPIRPNLTRLHAALQHQATALGSLWCIVLRDRCQALPGMASASLFGEGEPARLPCLRVFRLGSFSSFQSSMR